MKPTPHTEFRILPAKVNDDLQNLIASTDIATVFVDRAIRIKRFTPRATDIFSIIPTDIGRSLLDITHRLDYDSLADDAAEAFESLKLIEREVRSEDGRWYIARLLPYRTTEDRIEGAVLTFIDITGRRQAEEELSAGEERLRIVAETTKDYAIITFDLDGRITSWNTGAERTFGYQEHEVLGQSGEILFPPEEQARKAFAGELRSAREKGRAEEEGWLLRKGGVRLFCSGVLTPLQTGRFNGYSKILRDVTERRLAEQERNEQVQRERKTLVEAQTANHLKDEFLAVMSHELKNPLNLILINAELLGRIPEARRSPDITRVADVIRRSVLSQARIIDDLLDLSRVHTGKLKIERTLFDCTALVSRLAEVMGDAGGRTVEVECPDGPVFVHGDAVRVEQIITNLLSNALKFTGDQGRVQLRLCCEDDCVRIDVVDDGKGIAPQALPKIFDMFQQESGSASRRGGLGIGLALVKELVELHGGRVAAHSDGLGHGACFSVWLPAYRSGELPGADQRLSSGGSLRGLRILMVDDEAETLAAFETLIEGEGAVVETALGGAMALRVAAGASFDLLICDIGMPGMNGHQFLAELRKLPGHERLPAIAISGFARPNDIKASREAGFVAHLAKPAGLDDLIQAIRELGLQG